ncbi:MAG: hypothetical protein JWM68_2305, partial [Verrucomicrobiales bacterium]|nr:hypothetical protein [Verrucomicrobiales bacterium]
MNTDKAVDDVALRVLVFLIRVYP